MNIGGFGVVGSIAGAPLAQTKGADVERATQDTAAKQADVASELKAEQAAGIGETDGEEHTTNERDADGRRPWEFSEAKKPAAKEGEETPTIRSASLDGSGQQLDLLG